MRIVRRQPINSTLGPFTGEGRLQEAIQDGRTAVAKFYRATVDALLADIPDPTAMEMMIIELVASRMCRIYLANRRFFQEEKIEDKSEVIISWMNALRQDLMALGLKRRLRDVEVSLSSVIKEMNATPLNDEEGDDD